MISLIDEMEFFAAVLLRNAWEALFQVRLLERNQIELLATILPVDPPGESLSKPSVAVIDDCAFMI